MNLVVDVEAVGRVVVEVAVDAGCGLVGRFDELGGLYARVG